MPINHSGLSHSPQIFTGNLLDVLGSDIEWCVDTFDAHTSDQFLVFLHKHRDRITIGRLSDKVGHVDGEKVRAVKVLVDGVHIDMVGVHMPSLVPVKFSHGLFRSVIYALRL